MAWSFETKKKIVFIIMVCAVLLCGYMIGQ